MPTKVTSSTASEAGLDVRWSKWTAAQERTTRLEELVKHYSFLEELGMGSCQDE